MSLLDPEERCLDKVGACCVKDDQEQSFLVPLGEYPDLYVIIATYEPMYSECPDSILALQSMHALAKFTNSMHAGVFSLNAKRLRNVDGPKSGGIVAIVV